MSVCVKAAAAALLLSLVAACGSDEVVIDESPGETLVTYSCDEDREFQVLYKAGSDLVTMIVEGQELVLPQIPSTDGIAYSDGSFTFHAEGLEAYTRGWPGADFTNCIGSND